MFTPTWNKICCYFIFFLSASAVAQIETEVLRGNVTDAQTNLPVAGANVVILETAIGATTDSLGNFTLEIKQGKHSIRVSRAGYEPRTRELTLGVGGYFLNISLQPTAYLANEVTVSARRAVVSPGIHTITEDNLQNIPNLYSDVIRSVTILPGVTSDNELTSAYNVRGQNFDANLIYLSGFEIYRPYLVREGIEESQSPINQNMVGELKFYDGAFPVEYGDKMSSVLVINYREQEKSGLGGEADADLLNLGITLHDRIGALSWIAGFRYAYPSSFTNVLQTKGTYIPRYTDFQVFGNYTLANKIKLELLLMTARNSFNLTPRDWKGDFAVNAWNAFRRIVLKFSGADNYKYNSNVLGFRLTAPINANSDVSASLAYYSDRESYDQNLSYGIYYSPDAYNPAANVSYLATGYDLADNSLDMSRLEFKTEFSSNQKNSGTKAGISLRTSMMDNSLNESTYYDPPPGPYRYADQKQRIRFNSISGYVEENVILNPYYDLDLGLRALKYYFNGQFLVSPRASASFKPDSSNSLVLGWGYYYQPPHFYETRDKTLEQAKRLLAQEAIHYQLRYERKTSSDAHVMAEIYFKQLNNLLPYSYTNQLELTYGDTNNYNGYAYGLDLQYEGKLSQRLDTWIGYGYLVARDRRENGPYQHSLLDQTHTIRIFLQDAMPEIHNSQAHVRLLFGTGYYYHPMMNISGPGNTVQTVPDFDLVYPYPFYYRIDMGLTLKFDLGEKRSVTLNVEVLNVFDKNNIVSYSWYTIPQEFSAPIEVPNLLSARFFNAGVRVEF